VSAELEAIPEEEQQAVWQAYEELGDTLLKPVLQKGYGRESSEGGNGNLDTLYERLRLIRIRYRRQRESARHAG